LQGVGKDLEACLGPVRGDLALNLDAARRRHGPGVAESTKEMGSSSVDDMARMFGQIKDFLDVCAKAKAQGSSAEEKADGEAFITVHGRAHWLHPAATQQPAFAASELPGFVAYDTARGLAELLVQVEKGHVLRIETVRDMKRSRRPPTGGEPKLPVDLDHFAGREWGLGAELIAGGKSGGEAPGWGHTSSGGSFALVLPGPRPVAVAFLLNRVDGWNKGISSQVLKAVTEFAAGRSPAA